METGYAKPEKFTKDDTPVKKYSLNLSDRDISSLKSLESRNFAPLILPIANEFAAIVKIVNQLCDLNKEDENLDNYD